MKLINIKILGYCVLLFGLVAVSMPTVPQGGTLKALAIKQWQSMPQHATNNMAFRVWAGLPPQQEIYSRADLLAATENVAGQSWRIAGSPPVGGGLIMLIGAVLIDVGSRRKIRRST